MTTEMKTCSICGVEKPITEYGWKDKKAGRIRSSCKACENARAKKYREANPDKVKAANAKWAKEHRKERNAYARARHKKHKKEDNAKAKAYYEDNREQILEQKATYYEQNRDAIQKKQKRQYHKNRRYKKLTREQQLKLFEENKKLVFHIAKKYNTCPNDKHEDLIQAGYLGLWKGIMKLDKYAPNKGALSTWLCWSIYYEINHYYWKANNKSGLSAHANTIMALLRNKNATDKGKDSLSTEQSRLFESSTSLDKPIGDDDDDSTLGMLIGKCDEHYDGLYDEIKKMLSGLDYYSRNLIMYHFGIGCEPHTQREMAKTLGITHQMVAYHIQKALEQLRDMPGTSNLAVYL